MREASLFCLLLCLVVLVPSLHAEPEKRATNVVYNNGSVISGVELYSIFWTSDVYNMNQLETFAASIADSSYLDWLCEYNTPNQNITRGSYKGSFVVNSPDSTLTDDNIVVQIGSLIAGGQVISPGPSTLYLVFVDANTTVSYNSGTSCQSFCGYKNYFNYPVYPFQVYYAVIADCTYEPTAPCPVSGNRFNDLTKTASQQILDAITSPVNLTGWSDIGVSNGGIGGLCSNFSLSYTNSVDNATWVVTPGWSDGAGTCVLSRAGLGCINPYSNFTFTSSSSISFGWTSYVPSFVFRSLIFLNTVF